MQGASCSRHMLYDSKHGEILSIVTHSWNVTHSLHWEQLTLKSEIFLLWISLIWVQAIFSLKQSWNTQQKILTLHMQLRRAQYLVKSGWNRFSMSHPSQAGSLTLRTENYSTHIASAELNIKAVIVYSAMLYMDVLKNSARIHACPLPCHNCKTAPSSKLVQIRVQMFCE